jgi:hypothetical protein
MQIINYLIVLILVANNPVGVKFKNFETFAREVKLQEQTNCEAFSISKNENALIRKYFEIKEENVNLEVFCLSKEKFNEWILAPRKYATNKSNDLLKEENQLSTNENIKEYIGILRYKEPSSIKSVQAYSSTSFYLEVNGEYPAILNINPSETINHDTLKKFTDSKVKIKAKYTEQLPNPNESYPMEMTPDGQTKPMKRKFYTVMSIQKVK